MAQPQGMSGVPTSLGFVGQEPGPVDSVYDIGPLAFDVSEIPPFLQSAKDQIAKSYNSQSLLDELFSGPNIGLTVREIEEQARAAQVAQAIDQDLSANVLASEEDWLGAMQRLEAAFGNAPMMPEQAPLGQPDPATSIISGIAAALTPEKAFEIGAVPYQIEAKKQMQENQRRAIEYKNLQIKNEAEIEMARVGAQIQAQRVEWDQQKLEQAQKAAEAAKRAAEDATEKGKAQFETAKNKMAQSKQPISDLEIGSLKRLAVAAGYDPEAVQLEAEDMRAKKDGELAQNLIQETIQQVERMTRNGTYSTPETSHAITAIANRAVARLKSSYKYADKGMLADSADFLFHSISALSAPSRQLIVAQMREAGLNLRLEKTLEIRKKEFEERLRANGVNEGIAKRRVEAYEKSVNASIKKVNADIENDKAEARAARATVPKGAESEVRASVKEWRSLDGKYKAASLAWQKLNDEHTRLLASGKSDEDTQNRIDFLEIEMESALTRINNVSQMSRDLLDQLKAQFLQSTAAMTAEQADAWASRYGIPLEIFGVSNR